MKHGPVRTCVGCRERDHKRALLRVVVAGGRVAPDPRAVLPGRGAYVHHSQECAARAARRGGLARALRTAIGPEAASAVTEAVARERQRHAGALGSRASEQERQVKGQ
jgi:uncharacterized protein